MHIPACETTNMSILTFEDACLHKEDSAVYDRENGCTYPIFIPNTDISSAQTAPALL